jgi:hypothetical protein
VKGIITHHNEDSGEGFACSPRLCASLLANPRYDQAVSVARSFCRTVTRTKIAVIVETLAVMKPVSACKQANASRTVSSQHINILYVGRVVVIPTIALATKSSLI